MFKAAAYMSTARSTSLEPWFGPHVQRNVYLSLLHLEPQPGQEKANVPDGMLKAALLQRATEDIRRILAIRGQKQPLSQLLQRGSVGDDLWQRFLRAEKEMEEELRDVVTEVRTTVRVVANGILTMLYRRTPLLLIGDKQSFKVPMRWYKMPTSASGWPKYRRRPKQIPDSGRRRGRISETSLWNSWKRRSLQKTPRPQHRQVSIATRMRCSLKEEVPQPLDRKRVRERRKERNSLFAWSKAFDRIS